MLRPVPAAAAALLTVALASCGASEEDRVRDAVNGYGAAVAERDYQKICDELMARELVGNLQEIGLPCEVALRRGFGSVREPRLKITRVRVEKDRAFATVRTTAANQKPSTDTLRVVRQEGEWRIAGIGSAGAGRAAR